MRNPKKSRDPSLSWCMMGALLSSEASSRENSLVSRVHSPPRHWPETRTKKCWPRQRCPLPSAPLTAHSIRERKWVMPSPGGIIRVPEANFLLHDLGLEQIWGWRSTEHHQAGRGSTVGGGVGGWGSGENVSCKAPPWNPVRSNLMVRSQAQSRCHQAGGASTGLGR